MSILKVPKIYRIIETDSGFFIEERVRVIYWSWTRGLNSKDKWIPLDMFGYSNLHPVGPTAPAAQFDTLEKARDQIRKWEKPTYKIHEP